MTFPPSDRAWMLFRGTCALFTAGRLSPLLPSTPSHGRPSSARRPAPTRRSFPCGKEKRSGRRKARPALLLSHKGKSTSAIPFPTPICVFMPSPFALPFPCPPFFPYPTAPSTFRTLFLPHRLSGAPPVFLLPRSELLSVPARPHSPPPFLAPPFSSAALRRPPPPFPPSNTMPRRPLSLFRHALTCPEYGKSPPAP